MKVAKQARLSAPGARDAIRALAASISDLGADAVSDDPLNWPGYGEQLARARRRSGETESVVVTEGRIGRHRAVLIAIDFRFLGGSMGAASGARIVAAFRAAINRREPVVSLVASGGARMQEGMRALVQMQRIARASAEARRSGIPHIGVLRHPVTGGVWASLAASADLLLALPEATVAFAGPRVRGDDCDGDDPAFTSEGKYRHGFVDAVLEEPELRDRVETAVDLLAPDVRGGADPADVPASLSDRTAPKDAWESVQRARDPARPRAVEYLDRYFDLRVPISGDRCGGIDPSMLCGFGRRDGRTIAYAAQTGTPNAPAGFRTASRLIRMADHFQIPVLTLIDTPGAAHDAAAERGGVGTAIAELFQTVAASSIPITSLVIGEGGSGGALALAAEERLWIVPDGYFSVIAPEGAAAILQRDKGRASEVAARLALKPAELARLGIVNGIAASPNPPFEGGSERMT